MALIAFLTLTDGFDGEMFEKVRNQSKIEKYQNGNESEKGENFEEI